MSAVKNLLLATNNPKKIKEIREILGNEYNGRIFTAADFPELPEPEETGSTFSENARIKADYYSNHTGLISLADDSGLIVDALNGRPGVFSARYAPSEDLRITKLLAELTNVPELQRTARFACAICVAIPGRSHLEKDGTLEGHIATERKGTNGFGYDPIFLVDAGTRTLAEFSAEEKNLISHRGVAMKKIKADLLNALTQG